ncbi:hypothetical protein ACEPPN_005902 [Leptodophora sp. 'Broadleaf-Isolate-01']
MTVVASPIMRRIAPFEDATAPLPSESMVDTALSSVLPTTSAQQIGDYEDPSWRNLVDTYYYSFDPMSMMQTGFVDQLSPIDQDLMDYLSETVPNIWPGTAPESNNQMSHLNSPPESTVLGPSSGSIPMSSADPACSSTSPNDSNIEGTPSIDTNRIANLQDHLQMADAELPVPTLNIPIFVIEDLIRLYFQRVQVFLPLFHQPTFHKTHLQSKGYNKYASLENDSVFALYGMMALSARFSTLPFFEDINFRDRGNRFALKAQKMYHETILNTGQSKPSLVWLQGAILLAYYNQSSKPSLQCDLLISGCIRTAYDLGLHKIDEGLQFLSQAALAESTDEDWISKEERRRAWWAVWELDSYDSISCRHPFKIDHQRMVVLLPVSDDAWFSGMPIKSALLRSDILQCWKVLKDCPNQDERAWFLISNYITVHALELCQQRFIAQKLLDDIETVVSCFSHIFYERFQKNCNQLVFDEANYSKSNWLILTRLMIQSARIITCILNRRVPSEPDSAVSNEVFNTGKTHERAVPSAIPLADADNWFQPASGVLRIYQSWPPEYIGFVPPTMVSMITGPAAMVLRCARHLRKEQNGGDLSKPSIQEDLLVLILSHFARYWDIGGILLGTLMQAWI